MFRIVTVVLTASPPSMSQLSRQRGILNISQPYWPVTGIAFASFYFSLLAAVGARRWKMWPLVVGRQGCAYVRGVKVFSAERSLESGLTSLLTSSATPELSLTVPETAFIIVHLVKETSRGMEVNWKRLK
jgi:hypothetical protein